MFEHAPPRARTPNGEDIRQRHAQIWTPFLCRSRSLVRKRGTMLLSSVFGFVQSDPLLTSVWLPCTQPTFPSCTLDRDNCLLLSFFEVSAYVFLPQRRKHITSEWWSSGNEMHGLTERSARSGAKRSGGATQSPSCPIAQSLSRPVACSSSRSVAQ